MDLAKCMTRQQSGDGCPVVQRPSCIEFPLTHDLRRSSVIGCCLEVEAGTRKKEPQIVHLGTGHIAVQGTP